MAVLPIAIDPREAIKGGKQVEKALDGVTDKGGKARNELGQFTKQQKAAGDEAKRLSSSLKRAIAVFISFQAVKRVVRDLADFEQQLVGVGKTANLSAKDLALFGDEIIQLSTEIPATTQELLAIAQAAGQLGVTGAANIKLFTETITKLGSASDLAGEEAATALARILNVTQESIGTVGQLASVFVTLGNNVAATEREIARTTTRVAQATAQYRIGSKNAAALSAALAALGVKAELSGSAIGRSFRAIDAAIRDNGAAIKSLSQETGVAVTELGRIFREDATKGFELFLQSIKRVNDEGRDVAEFLGRFGLKGNEVLSVLPTLAQRTDLLAQTLRLANAETTDAVALNEEAAKAYNTLNSSLIRFGSAFDAIILSFKESNGPLKEFVDTGTDILRGLAGLETQFVETDNVVKQITATLKVFAAILVFIAAIKIVVLIVSLTKALFAFAVAAKTAAVATALLQASLLIVAVAFAALLGLEIGRFLRDEFKVAREAGDAFAFAVLRAFEDIRFGFEAMGILIRFTWDNLIDLMKVAFSDFILFIAKGYDKIVEFAPDIAKALNFDGASDALKRFASEVTAGTDLNSVGLLADLSSAADKSKQKIDELIEAEKSAQAETDKLFGSRSRRTGNSFGDFLAADLEKAQGKFLEFQNFLGSTDFTQKFLDQFKFTFKEIEDGLSGDTFTPTVGPFPDIKKDGDDMKDIFKDLGVSAKSIGQQLGSGISDAVFEAKRLSDVVTDIGRTISKQVLNKLVGAALTTGFGNLFPGSVTKSANGNVFSGGNVQPFANGGVVNSPVAFPLAGGNTGLAGEAGPEAILPLRRKGGKLGVETSGGGGNSFNVVMNVTTKDADSFNQSRTQILADLRAGLGGA